MINPPAKTGGFFFLYNFIIPSGFLSLQPLFSYVIIEFLNY
jgi:hypothetical protein